MNASIWLLSGFMHSWMNGVGRGTYRLVALWAHCETHSRYLSDYGQEEDARVWPEMELNLALGCCGRE